MLLATTGLEKIALLFPKKLSCLVWINNTNPRGSTRGSHLHIFVSGLSRVDNKAQNAEMIVVSEKIGQKKRYVKPIFWSSNSGPISVASACLLEIFVNGDCLAVIQKINDISKCKSIFVARGIVPLQNTISNFVFLKLCQV